MFKIQNYDSNFFWTIYKGISSYGAHLGGPGAIVSLVGALPARELHTAQ